MVNIVFREEHMDDKQPEIPPLVQKLVATLQSAIFENPKIDAILDELVAEKFDIALIVEPTIQLIRLEQAGTEPIEPPHQNTNLDFTKKDRRLLKQLRIAI